MKDEIVIIRSAQKEDIEMIWDLFHANCRNWTGQQIEYNLPQLFVLLKSDKLLGVLHGEFKPGTRTIFWVEIHPLYPEKILREVMIQGLCGAQIGGSWSGLKSIRTGQRVIHPFDPVPGTT